MSNANQTKGDRGQTVLRNPEFLRAQLAIEDAVSEMELEGGDVRTFATCLLSLSAGFYALVLGHEGPEGLPNVLAKMARREASRAAQKAEEKTYGKAGRA